MDFDLTAVIPARLNSSRVKQKALQELDGKNTLLGIKIKQLLKILPRERVVVNTESEILAEHAQKFGATIHWRDPYFSDGHIATFSELIVHVTEGIKSEHVAWTPFVVPFFDSEQLQQSFKNYETQVINGEYDSLVSVTELRAYLWNDHGPINYIADHRHTISQELPATYQVTNGNYMAPQRTMQEMKYVLGKRVYLDVRHDKCKIDIDTIEDLKLARAFGAMEN